MTGQETKTLLQAGTVVEKDCQRIALRGLLDTACAYCVCALSAAQGKNIRAAEDAKEMLSVLYDLTRCEALGEPYEFRGVFGFGADEVRAASHNPQKYIAAEHCFTLDETTPMEVALLNLLRNLVSLWLVASSALVLALPLIMHIGKNNISSSVLMPWLTVNILKPDRTI